MRLLNVQTRQLEEFVDGSTPPYSILSHTWGDDEVSFQDMVTRHGRTKRGYQKILGCCAKTASEGISYAWIDTCCIDKSSSSELSEAINSMFSWYRNAEICYAFLEDINRPGEGALQGASSAIPPPPKTLSSSRWFTRGWTLQELLAPAEVIFLDAQWAEIGSKTSCADHLSGITGIPPDVLSTSDWSSCSIAQRLSWAAERQTTRIEDEAYSLLGLFGINMPLLYGEGSKAFIRLQQELLRVFDDYSIFAWTSRQHECTVTSYNRGLLATSPAFFKSSGQIRMARFNAKYPMPGLAGQTSNQATESTIACEPKRHIVEMTLPSTTAMDAAAIAGLVSPWAVVYGRAATGPEPFRPRMCRHWLCPSDTLFALALLNCEHANGDRLAVLLMRAPSRSYFERSHCPSIVHLNKSYETSLFAVHKLIVASGSEYVSRLPHTPVSSKHIVVRFAGVQELGYTKVTPDRSVLWSYDGRASNSHRAEGVPAFLVLTQGDSYDGRRLPSIRICWKKDSRESDTSHKTFAICDSLPPVDQGDQRQSQWRCITRGSHTMIYRLSDSVHVVVTVRQAPRSILHTIRIVERRQSAVQDSRQRTRSPSPASSDISGFTSDSDKSWDEMEEDT